MTHLSHGPIERLTAGQFKKALKLEKPVVAILPEQYKFRMQHYTPLHPQVVEAVFHVTEGRGDHKLVLINSLFNSGLGITKLDCCTAVLGLPTL